MTLFIVALWAVHSAAAAAATTPVIETDLCVYGGTSGGVIAAVQAARLGHTVALIHEGNHLGGMTTAGLGVTDIGQAGSIGGMSREFYRRVGQRYGVAERFQFEPRVAEEVFWQMLQEAGVGVYTNRVLSSVVREDRRLRELVTGDGLRFRAGMFIDTTYEGDLMAAAGVTFTVGREDQSVYGESLAGARPVSSGGYDYDPYTIPGQPASGLLPLLQGTVPGPVGAGDTRVQAYNFRLCLTAVASNRLAIAPPANYAESRFELVARYVEARLARDGAVTLGQLIHLQTLIPNGKTDINANGELSTDYVGGSWTWATNTPAGRALLRQDHEDYLRGLLHFLATSTRVPLNVRTQMQAYGLARDEFTDRGGWPHQLYVREARRMVGGYIITQADALGGRFAPDSIGLASYQLDSHALTRVAVEGRARTEGGLFTAVPQPFPLSYRAIIPRTGECANLFCTFALSASHVAFSSCRMEPVFMITSQSAATAASLCLADRITAQELDYARLAPHLRADGQVLDWVGGALTTNGVILDNGEPGVSVVGSWVTSTSQAGFWGANYWHDQNSGKGTKFLRYTPDLPFAGAYDVFARWTAFNNRAANVPWDVIHAGGTNRVYTDQTQNDATWVRLLRTNFVAGQGGGVILRNDGTTGFVVADAVRFQPVAPFSIPPPTVQILARDSLAVRSTTNTAWVSLIRQGDLSAALTVSLHFGGTATNGVDVASLPTNITFAAGAAVTNLTIRPQRLPGGDTLRSLTISIVPRTNISIGAAGTAIITIAERPYHAWRWQRFTAVQLADGTVSGDAADPDGDGWINLAEYACGLDPLRADREGIPRAMIQDDRLVLSYQQHRQAGDVRLGVLGGSQPGPWSTNVIGPPSVRDWGWVQGRSQGLKMPASAGSEGYLELIVELAP